MFSLILHFNFDALGSRVAEGVDQRFAANTVDFIADYRVHRTGAAFNNDAKINLLLVSEFLPDTGKCLFDIKRVTAGRRTEALQ